MDHNVAAAQREMDNAEAAAERKHFDRMSAIHDRLRQISDEIVYLEEQDRLLRSEICELVGVGVGDVLTDRAGRRLEVKRVRGDFWPHPTEDAVVPEVRCTVAPATKTGFHPRTRQRHSEFDWDCKIPIAGRAKKAGEKGGGG